MSTRNECMHIYFYFNITIIENVNLGSCISRMSWDLKFNFENILNSVFSLRLARKKIFLPMCFARLQNTSAD